MAEQLGIGVIGAGVFGKLHARVCAELTETRLVGVWSRHDETLRPIRQRYGVGTTTDLEELVRMPEVDAVIVCTPDHAHLEPVLAAIRAGKHVLVEKPMATSVGDCEQMIAAAREREVLLTVGHIVRFDPRYHQAHEAIRSGRIGRLVHMCARRSNPRRACERAFGRTNPVFWLGSHDIDMFLWCAGSQLRSVYAQQNTRVLGERGPDAVLAILTFADGTLAALETCWVLPDTVPSDLDAEFEAVGTEGLIRINATNDGITLCDARALEHPRSVYGAEVAGSLVGALRQEVREFARCIMEGRSPLVAPEDGREVVRAACAIAESAACGRPVAVARER